VSGASPVLNVGGTSVPIADLQTVQQGQSSQ
jgi:hypothetical protein